MNQFLITRRLLYVVAAAVVMVLGLSSRRYREELPSFVAEYSGDVLWALMLFLLMSALLAGKSIGRRAAFCIVIAFLIEFSQLYHAAWIDGIRATTIGGLVLGFGFLWTDLICYSVGISLGALADWGIMRAALSIRRTKNVS